MKKVYKIIPVILLIITIFFVIYYKNEESKIKETPKISLNTIKFDVLDYDDAYSLTDIQKETFKIIINSILNHEEEINVSTSFDENLLYSSLIKDNPLMFLIDKTSLKNSNKTIVIKYLYDKKEHDSKIKYITDEYISILNNIIYEDYNDLEKILAIYKYFSEEISYDYDWYNEYLLSDDKFNLKEIKIYDALVNKSGVCHSYALLVQLALHQFDIEYINTTGEIKKRDESHSWLRVKINDNFYHIDPTWESEEAIDNKIKLTYFGMTDERRNSKEEFFWIPTNIEVKCSDNTFDIFEGFTGFEFVKNKHLIKLYYENDVKYFNTSTLLVE